MVRVRRLVVDVLKPHDPSLVEFSRRLGELETVDGVTASLIELDQEVQNVKFTVVGEDLDPDRLEGRIEELGGTVHSVDQVSCGDVVVQDQQTLQDP